MSSGAFALYLDPPAGSGGNPLSFKRVIPLLPITNGGTTHFNHGRLSLVYDDFLSPGPHGPAVKVTLRVNGGPPLDLMIPVGKTLVHTMAPGDTVASFDVQPEPNTHPSLAALVEYS
jgi:hypothetical protein